LLSLLSSAATAGAVRLYKKHIGRRTLPALHVEAKGQREGCTGAPQTPPNRPDSITRHVHVRGHHLQGNSKRGDAVAGLCR